MPRDAQPHALFLRQNQFPPKGVFVFSLMLGCAHDALSQVSIILLLREERRREERIATPAPTVVHVPAPTMVHVHLHQQWCMLAPRQSMKNCHPWAPSAVTLDPDHSGLLKISQHPILAITMNTIVV
jgi:hypothetical protein